MTRTLSPSLKLITLDGFPGHFPPSSKRYRALIGIGGNVGNTPRRFKRLLRYLAGFPLIDVIGTHAEA